MKLRFKGLLLWAGLVYFVLYLPIAVMIVNSFNASKYSTRWGGFTLKWYRDLFHQQEILSALSNSLFIGGVSTMIAIVLGTLGAVAMQRKPTKSSETRKRVKASDLVEALLMCPVILPDIVMGLSLLMLFVFIRVELSRFTIILSHVTFCMVYVLIVVRVRLKGLDPALEEASRDLGANAVQTFFKIILPLILPGVIAGGLLGFTLSFEDFVITFFTAGVGSTTLPIQIYSMAKFGVSPVISALSTVFLVLTAAVTLLLHLFKAATK